MVKVFSIDELKALAKMDFPLAIQRADVFPLDPSSLFVSKADADLYAAGGADARGLGGTVYAGQIISVVENNVVSLYTVETNGTLKAVGGDVSADLADLTSKVNAILADADENLNTFAEVKAKFDSLPKDMVVSGGEVRKATEADKEKDSSVVVGEEYIILTIANSETVLYIPAKSLVDAYTGGDYVSVSNSNVIDVNVAALEAKLTADDYAKKADITTATSTLATQESLNALSAKVDNNTTNIQSNTDAIAAANQTIATKADQSALDEATGRIDAIETNVADIKVKDVDTTASNGVNLELSEAGVISVVANIKVKEVNVAPSNGVKLTLSETGELGVSVDPTAFKAGVSYDATDIKTKADIGDGAIAAGTSVESALTTLNNKITSAISGGLTNINAGNGIEVSEVSGNSQTVSIKVADKDNSNLHADASGLSLVWIEE